MHGSVPAPVRGLDHQIFVHTVRVALGLQGSLQPCNYIAQSLVQGKCEKAEGKMLGDGIIE